MKQKIQTRNIVFEATDPRIVDDELNRLRKELEEENGEVFHTQTHVTTDTRVLAKLTAKYLKALTDGKKIDISQDEPGLIYTCFAFFKQGEPDEDVKEILKDVKEKEAKVLEVKLQVKKENENKKRWCTCPQCNQRWAYNYFNKCRCGNAEPPTEARKEYDEIW